MNFIEAVLAITWHPDYRLCDDPTEWDGTHPSICVHREDATTGQFVGKLRWRTGPDGTPEVDLPPACMAELETVLPAARAAACGDDDVMLPKTVLT